MAFAQDLSFARVVATSDDRVEMAFDMDPQRFTWVNRLPPQHPVVIDKYLYFAPLTALFALELATPKTQTALTALTWQCHDLEVPGLATRGVCTLPGIAERDPSFVLELWTASGEHSVTATGSGVAFANRDFEAWRAKAKQQIRVDAADFEPATRAQLHLGDGWIPFVSAVQPDGHVRALVTRETGFPPANPFHNGSGDHVNVPHLHDCALQAAQLLRDQPLRCQGGDARFMRYIELDASFELRVTHDDGDHVRFAVIQQGHPCAELGLQVVPGELA